MSQDTTSLGMSMGPSGCNQSFGAGGRGRQQGDQGRANAGGAPKGRVVSEGSQRNPEAPR